jgi:hypothetical protein
MNILDLSSGMVSLEFKESERELVFSRIESLFGPIGRRWFAAAAKIKFGGEGFVFDDEYGDLCLISISKKGAEMLRRIERSIRLD